MPASWKAPDAGSIPDDATGRQIRYGRALIANTASYLGPKGTVAHISNGMNCQNCHLEAGTKPFGNNYSAVASTYPKFRERSGAIENICKRVNDCFERSLNGHALDSASAEMKAIEAYIRWLGKDVKKGNKPAGAGIEDLPFPDRPADPLGGAVAFKTKCISCHGEDGQGKMNAGGMSYQYPPLWGPHSYNTGAGLYRLTRFAGYIKNNMPQGASKSAPQLSNEEAWDIAAFVNSQDRPEGNISKDWPRIAGKPIDNPFGPYADGFSEKQHKLGPYAAIAEYKEKHKKDKDAGINLTQKK
ncbi:MAG TPA: c-type cytochrome [Bacteroidia bacterium]|nr:c-type cytochrome [Bacteroidia bacterium]